jgi:hypothetical protein
MAYQDPNEEFYRREAIRQVKLESRREFLVKAAKITTVGGLASLALEGINFLNQYEKNANSVDKDSFAFESHAADQIFRDHNGYRVFFTDGNQKLREVKYKFEFNPLNAQIPQKFRENFREMHPGCITVFKDLDEKTRGYANVLTYGSKTGIGHYYVEMHIPKSSVISPGNESFGGKYKTNAPMQEVK